MMAIRSQRMSASSMECVVSTMARSALWRRMMSHVSLAHTPSCKKAAYYSSDALLSRVNVDMSHSLPTETDNLFSYPTPESTTRDEQLR